MTETQAVEMANNALSVVQEYVRTLDVRTGDGVDAYRRAVQRARDLLDQGAFPREVKRNVDATNDFAADNYLAAVKLLDATRSGSFERFKTWAARVFIVALYVFVILYGVTSGAVGLIVYCVPVFLLERLLLKDPFSVLLFAKCFEWFTRKK